MRLASGLISVVLGLAAVSTVGTEALAQLTGGSPDFVGQIVADRASGNVPLERAMLAVGSRVRALGLGGAKVFFTIRGERSPVRFKSGQKLGFVMRLSNANVDPRDLVDLVRIEVRKDNRRLALGDAQLFGGRDGKSQDLIIPTNMQMLNGSMVSIKPAQPLPPGEYAFRSSQNTQSAQAFGVD